MKLSMGYTPQENLIKELIGVYTTGKPDKGTDWVIIRKDGTERIVEASASLMKDNEDRPIGFRGVLRDITEKKLAEKELQEHAMRNELILRTAMDGFCIHDLDGYLLEVNEATSRITGYSCEELVDMTVFDFETRPPQELWEAVDEAIKDGYGHFETKLRGKERVIDVEVSLNYAPIGEGFMFSFLRDITRRKLSEQMLREKDRELEIKSNTLEETNKALRLLLTRADEDKRELEEKVLFNIKKLIMPHMEKLKKVKLNERAKAYINIVESNLIDIISPLSRGLHNLTPAELQVANLVKDGRTAKEIADLLNLSIRTIEDYRKKIRKKLGLTNKKVNLRMSLLSIR
jgi:PAS domain S-box-containing protein